MKKLYPPDSLLNPDPVAEFIEPDLGDKVNSGIGMLHRSARPHGLVQQLYAGVDFIPKSEIYKFG